MHFIVYNTYRGKMTGNNGTQAGEKKNGAQIT